MALKQARKKLGILSSITRHDIRNQVQVLLSILDLISDEKYSQPDADLLKKAFTPCKNILESLSITAEYQVLGVQQPKWFSVKKLVENAIQTQLILDDQCFFIGNDVEIFADPLISKVFENLIDNTIRHAENFKTIFFKTELISKDCILTYRDYGIGIPQEEKDSIFIEGYGKNTGLGLSLIRDILSITGMTIVETGIYGEGARFEIRIPYGKWRLVEKI